MKYIIIYFKVGRDKEWRKHLSYPDINRAHDQKHLCEKNNPRSYRFLVVEEHTDLSALPLPVN